ncbi:BMP family ABC transporter substrate-binding protein [Alteromonadales bacterium alter-6D02]|nr:BMP family ABC transporter substrate-binding protein [Alteromonadales bacterium alter-6D02]
MILMYFSTAVAVERNATRKAAVVYDRPSKFDHSFNQAVFDNGVIKLKVHGVEVKEFEPANSVQIEKGILKLAARGYNPIVGVGYATAPAIARAANLYPQVSFIIIDSVVEAPNVQSILFKEEQGAYLAGKLAALKSHSGIIGFIGGMDIPLIDKFSCGYELGAQSVNSDIKILKNYLGSTLHAWNDPSKGLELAIYQIEQQADVIFSAAGGSGLGVFQAAKDYQINAIGVDSNQNILQPGIILTSMVKRVGRAVFKNVMSFYQGTWQPGVFQYGLESNWVDLAKDKYNQDVYTEEFERIINKEKALIINHELERLSLLNECAISGGQ